MPNLPAAKKAKGSEWSLASFLICKSTLRLEVAYNIDSL
jgi:hypothetical protein